MGKKIKKKTRNSGHRDRRVSSGSPRTIPKHSNPTDETRDDEYSVVKERKGCTHLGEVDLEKVSSKIGSSEPVRCEGCMEGAPDRRAGKEKSKHGKKKGRGPTDVKSETNKSIWVCLSCGHFACGGIGLPTTPQSHAIQHFRFTRHPCVIQLDNPHLGWCFPCNFLIPVEKSEENGEQKDILSDITKLIKGRSPEVSSVDVEDIWFGGGSQVLDGGDKTKLGEVESQVLDGKGGGGYTVCGLVNLGNTCFFNSVMQNLFAMDLLRDYFMKLDQSFGPLTMALKKLINETSLEVDSKNGLNPKALFGCICSKSPQFRGYQQQDSHELLHFLLDGLCTEELSARKLLSSTGNDGMTSNQGSTFVDMIFGGQLSSTVCCVECGHSSVVFEPFLDLSLPVPTKKPPSNKAPLFSRPRKTKLPIKKGGRARLKGNTNTTPPLVQSEPGPSESSGSSCLVQSSVPVAKQMDALVDDITWLDYAGAGEVSNDFDLVSQNFDVPSIQDAEEKQIFQNSAEQTVPSLDQLSWLDYIDPIKEPSDQDLVSQNYDISVVEDYENKQLTPSSRLQNNSDSHSRACSPNGESKLEFASSQSNTCEDEPPLQIQGSEVLLLPYKDDNSNNEETIRKECDPSTSVVGCEYDTFDGLGDLFNEPEMPAVSNAESWLCDKNFQCQASEVTETSFLAGNSSDSGPDEVDNTDAPVSIDSCLAHFTKPEILSNEHAWHCERCSKILRSQRRKYKNDYQQTTPKTRANADEIRRLNNCPLGSDENSMHPTKYRQLGNGKLEGDTVSTSTAESASLDLEIPGYSNPKCTNCENGQMSKERGAGLVDPVSNCLVNKSKFSQGDTCIGESSLTSQEPLLTLDQSESSTEVTFGDQITDSCGVDDSTSMLCNSSKTEPQVFQLLGRVHEPDDSDDEEMDSENLKVKRDATKRVLINRAPPILTIHLKRFSQDAHGRLSKLNGYVIFRDVIDLRPYMDSRCGEEREKCEYRLVGVVEHSGTMRGGHYVAYVRGRKGRGKTNGGQQESTWYYVSDAHVREVSLTEVLRSEAYILFYEKV